MRPRQGTSPVAPGLSPARLVTRVEDSGPLQHRVSRKDAVTRLDLAIRESHPRPGEVEPLQVPFVAPGRPVPLAGKLPLWRWTALVLYYRGRVPWLAVYQRQAGPVVVWSASTSVLPGAPP